MDKSLQRGISIFVMISMFVSIFSFAGSAFAAALTSISDTMSSSKINATSTHALRFTTPTGASDNTDTIIIQYPADFDFSGKTTTTVTFTHGAVTGAETTETLDAGGPTNAAWGAVFSGTEDRILTLTAPSDGIGAAVLAASDKVIISYATPSSTNPSVASTTAYMIGIRGTFGDTGTTTVNILNDDQVALTATVDQSLSFSISDNSVGFGTLSAADDKFATGDGTGNTNETEAHTLIVGTNAAGGYTMSVNGNTLTSGGNTITAIGAANTATSVGSEQYGLRMTAAGGSGAVSAPYADAGYAFDSAAFPDAVASAGGASANTTYSVRYIANITANTEAGAYTSTLTYTATANF